MIMVDGYYAMTNNDRAAMNAEINRVVAKESVSYTGTIIAWFDNIKGKLTYQLVKGFRYERPTEAHITCVGGMVFYKGCKNPTL